MEIWRQNAKDIERGARDDANNVIREQIEKIEEAGVKAEAETETKTSIQENENELGDRREDDAEDDDFGLEDEQKNKKNLKWKIEGDLKLNLKKDNRD
jgi:hypothetical protein